MKKIMLTLVGMIMMLVLFACQGFRSSGEIAAERVFATTICEFTSEWCFEVFPRADGVGSGHHRFYSSFVFITDADQLQRFREGVSLVEVSTELNDWKYIDTEEGRIWRFLLDIPHEWDDLLDGYALMFFLRYDSFFAYVIETQMRVQRNRMVVNLDYFSSGLTMMGGNPILFVYKVPIYSFDDDTIVLLCTRNNKIRVNRDIYPAFTWDFPGSLGRS